MIKKIFFSLFFLFTLSCNNVEFVLNEYSSPNPIKNNVFVIVSGDESQKFAREVYSFFGGNKENGYILTALFNENKENRVVKKNQVAEKIDYEIDVKYDLYYKKRDCRILSKNIITKFTASPKSFGYNFGADRSFEKLYTSSIKKNVQNFIKLVPYDTNCIK